MKKKPSTVFKACLAVVAISSAASGFAASDLDGTVKERIHSHEANDVIVGFARCSTLLVNAAVVMQINGAKQDDTSLKIAIEYGNFYAQQTYQGLGATTDEQKRKINTVMRKLGDDYRQLQQTDDGLKKARADSKDCFDFIADSQKENK